MLPLTRRRERVPGAAEDAAQLVSPGCPSLRHPKELGEAGSVFNAWKQILGDTSASQDVANKKGII